jgi:hypothetical protein
MGRIRRRRSVGIVAVVLAVGAALPAGASQHEGGVLATVTVGTGDPGDPDEACILLSTTELDFGTVNFGASAVGPAYEIDKCTEEAQDLWVLGSEIALTADHDLFFFWELTDETTTPGVNEFALTAYSYAIDDSVLVDFWGKRLLSDMPASSSFHHELFMPAIGSDGMGEVFEILIVWVGVLADD